MRKLHLELWERTLSDIEERTIGELTLQIDRLLCVGFGDCIDVSADAFGASMRASLVPLM